MSGISLRVVSAAGLACLLLAGCEEGMGTPGATGEGASPSTQAPKTVVQEVERGDIFSTKELGLWDGRPSLGGVWVAHPDVRDPERARVRNTTNGQTIGAALFRRERNNPGPRIQISSDAAAALGILAGQPTELEIIVLRTEEVVIEPDPQPEPAPEPEVEEKTAQAEKTASEAPAEIADAAPAVAAASVAAAAEPEAKQKGFWSRFRDSLRNDPAPAVTVIGATTVTAATATDASAPSVETAPLDPIAAASAAIDAAETEGATASQSETVVETAAITSPAPLRASGLKNPYIQIGLFGEKANASAASSSLRQAGIVPTVVEGRNGNGQFWRILVGPVTTAEDQSELLAQVRGMGYADAYLTSN